MCNTQKMMMVGLGALAVVATGPAGLALWGAEAGTLTASQSLAAAEMAQEGTAAAGTAVSGTTLATGLQAAATATSAYGQIESGKTAKDVADYNARVGKLKADSVIKDAGIAEDLQRTKTRQIEGSQNATLGASGIDPTTGTASRVLDQTATMGELDAQTIRTNALRQAWGLETQSNLDLVQGNASRKSGLVGGMGTLLAGGSRAYGIYHGSSSAYNNYGG